MRLGLIDRLRRLVRWRETAGRHRMTVLPKVGAAPRAGTPGPGGRDLGSYRGVQRQRVDAPLRSMADVPRHQLAQQPFSPHQQQLPWDGPAVPVGSTARLAGHGSAGGAAAGAGAGRARIREAPHELEAEAQYGAAPVEAAAVVRREPWYQVVPDAQPARRANGQIVPRTQALSAARAQALHAQAQHAQARQPLAVPSARLRLPYVAAHTAGHPDTADGRVNCGPLERVLHRQWTEDTVLPSQVITAVSRLAALPRHLQEKLADGLTGIFIGPGGVPDLDDMGSLKGVPLPSGRATWDACAGAYGERKIVVGSRLSPTPDVVCHEVGHALDDLDAPGTKWQSDSPEFKSVYDQCKPHLVSDFHRQRGGLGRKEFFADAFAAIASGQRPALVDMLGGDTRSALWVMLYFNRRYGI